MRRRWRSCCHALAVGVLALSVALSPGVAGAADGEESPGQLQVIQIGAQVVAVDPVGNAVLYDYPPGEAPDCEGLAGCWGFSARGAAGVVIVEGGEVVAVDVASGRVFVEERAAPP
jgi:hypothetical protein